jgi:hypothetical protein
LSYDLSIVLPFGGADGQLETALLDAVAGLDTSMRWQLVAADRGGQPAISSILASAEGDLAVVRVGGRPEPAALAAAMEAASGQVVWCPPASTAPDPALLDSGLRQLVVGGFGLVFDDEIGLIYQAEKVSRNTLTARWYHPTLRSIAETLGAELAADGVAVRVAGQPRLPGPDAEEVGLTPLLMSLISGRTGSTLLMQLLATAPSIDFDRVAPYENNYLAYLTNLSNQTAEPAPAQPGDARRQSPPALLPPPFPTMLNRNELAGRLLRGMWREFSDLRREQRPEARFWAEKFGDRPVPTTLPAAKVILLVRDPRDIWCSINSFDDQRGFYGFGRRQDEDRASFLRFFLESVYDLLDRSFPPSASVLLVRYEDLVTDIEREARRIGAWLGVRLDPAAVVANRSSFRDHMTSADPASDPSSSVGRWHRDLSPDEREIFRAEAGLVIAQLGYPDDPSMEVL